MPLQSMLRGRRRESALAVERRNPAEARPPTGSRRRVRVARTASRIATREA